MPTFPWQAVEDVLAVGPGDKLKVIDDPHDTANVGSAVVDGVVQFQLREPAQIVAMLRVAQERRTRLHATMESDASSSAHSILTLTVKFTDADGFWKVRRPTEFEQ